MPHPYQCYTEITCQAPAWQECLEVVTRQEKEIRAFFDRAQPDQIIFTGCTSPYYIGKSAAPFWQSALGIHTTAVTCSELIQFPEAALNSPEDRPVLVAISRSGKTSEAIWAVEAFEKRYPGRSFLITCAPDSPLARLIPRGVSLPKGHEKTLAQTSSYSAMMMAAQMIGALLSGQEDILRRLETASALVDPLIARVEPLVKDVMHKAPFQNIFMLGSGPLYGVAKDAALKMMEMSLSETMSFPFLESRHGPKSIIGEQSLIIGLCSHGGAGYEAQLLEEYTAKNGAVTVAITPSATWNAGSPAHQISVECDWPDPILGLLYLPVVQLLAYYYALAKGVNPDESRNLTQYIEIPAVSSSA